jgi:hypothetical protein
MLSSSARSLLHTRMLSDVRLVRLKMLSGSVFRGRCPRMRAVRLVRLPMLSGRDVSPLHSLKPRDLSLMRLPIL